MIGETLGGYKVVSRIGAGGMGEVFLAEHALIGRRAAIKVLLPELSKNQEIVQRFFNEARSTAMIRHAGLVDVFDFGYHQASGSAYLAMELLDGESLGARLRRERVLAPGFAVTVARQIAGALAAAHEKGIVHRDLKPDNLFLVPDKDVVGGVRVKVLDFGIAKLAGDPGGEGSLRTRTGAVMGTPVYMSPEQCKGAGQVDHRSDVYALGCILFECLSGKPPFSGEGFGEILGKHMYEAPPLLAKVAPGLPAVLGALVARTLAKDPGDRPKTMLEVEAELEQLAPLVQTLPPLGTGPATPVVSVSPDAPTQAPRHLQTPTTLAGSAAQLGRAEPPVTTGAGRYSRRRGVYAALGGLAVAGVAVIAIGVGGGGGGRPSGAASEHAAAPTRATDTALREPPPLAMLPASAPGDAGAVVAAAAPDAGTVRAPAPRRTTTPEEPPRKRPPPTTGPLELPDPTTGPPVRPDPQPAPDKGAFNKVLQRARPRVAPCAEGKPGTMMVRAKVAADGTVEQLEVTSPDFDERVTDCAEVVFRALQFPSSPRGWSFHLPVRLAGAGAP